MNIFDIIMEEVNPASEGFFDIFKSKKPKGFVSVEIDSPLGTLHTIDKSYGENSSNLLQTDENFSFNLFGKKYENQIQLTNIGTNEEPKYDPKEITAIQKALKIIPTKKNAIKKELYDYLNEFEYEYFQDSDYDENKQMSKTCQSLNNDAACRNFYSDVSIGVSTYNGVAIAYLDIGNDDVLGEGLVCTIIPEIRVDDWESLIFEDLSDDYR